IIHIHAEFYRGIWFSFAQKAHSFHMGGAREQIHILWKENF
ncbi:hypothetical protein HMPREF1547_02400, partial [Blautia sp. KLE 1732]